MARGEFDNAGSYVQVKDLEGELVLFTPQKHIEEVETSFGTKDAVLADLAVLHADGSADEYDDVMIFQGAMIGTLRRRIKTTKGIDRDPVSGVVSETETVTVRRVLGVVTKGEAKKGQNAPYIIASATDEQIALANAYVKDNPTPDPVTTVVKQYVDTGTVIPQTAPAAQAPAQVAQVSAPGTAPVSTPAANPVSPEEDPFAV